jgi:hypothetical protein
MWPKHELKWPKESQVIKDSKGIREGITWRHLLFTKIKGSPKSYSAKTQEFERHLTGHSNLLHSKWTCSLGSVKLQWMYCLTVDECRVVRFQRILTPVIKATWLDIGLIYEKTNPASPARGKSYGIWVQGSSTWLFVDYLVYARIVLSTEI